jgi:hypothetical protein
VTRGAPADASPDAPASITAAASGSQAEWSFISGSGQPGEVEITNATCAPNVARIVVGFPLPEGGITLDMMGQCWKKQLAAEKTDGGG